MTQPERTSTTPKPKIGPMDVLSAVALFLPVTLLGFLLGGFVATRVMKSTGMGWDRLADALGGMMVGTLLGVILATVLVVKLKTRQRWIAAAAALAALAVVWVLFQLVPLREAPVSGQASVEVEGLERPLLGPLLAPYPGSSHPASSSVILFARSSMRS